MKKIYRFCLSILIASISFNAFSLNNSQQQALVSELLKDNRVSELYSKADLDSIIKNAQYKQSIIDAFHRPAESLTWDEYRKIFIKDSLINSGVEFARKNMAILNLAEKEYGVPKQIILAILGVETAFGQNKGKSKIIDSLSTLSLGYEKRKDFFFNELKSFLILGKQHNLDVNTAVGSYAGAMGFPQFISSSYLAYAVDFDNDGKIDLINSLSDAIGSIGNYLSFHGWQVNQPIYSEINGQVSDFNKFIVKDRKALYPISQLNESNIKLQTSTANNVMASIIDLKMANETKYRAAFTNFYVITSYNHSKLYAMAVTELAEQIQNKM